MSTKQLSIKKRLLSFCILLSGIIFTSCNSNQMNQDSYQKLVKTSYVEKISSVKQKHFPGIIEEAEEVNIAFRVAGPIAGIYVKEGQYVVKGQLIAEMDTRDYLIQKKALEVQVQQLQSEYKRIAELHKRKSVSDNDYEKMKAGKEMAEEQLKNAKDQLDDTKLYAPFSGYITDVMFKEGEMLNHGTPVARIINVGFLKVDINVPADMYFHKDDITEIICTQDALPGESFPLKISGNNIKANNNGLYKLYLIYQPISNSKLLPGMNVSVKISYKEANMDLMSIPAKAIFNKDDKSYVWVVNNQKVYARQVKCNNIIKNGKVGIVEGLKANEEIVTGGLNLLTEGDLVKTIPPKSKTNIGNIL